MFTTSTIFASVLLFQGFDTSGAAAVSLLGGFVTTFLGVYLLNLNCATEESGLADSDHGPQYQGAYSRLGDDHVRESFELAGGRNKSDSPYALQSGEDVERQASVMPFHDQV